MRFSEEAIVLHSIRHGDKRMIVKLFTRGHGLVTVIATASQTGTAKVRSAALQPLTLLHTILEIRHNREIQALQEARIAYVPRVIPHSVQRLCIAQFMQEVLVKCIREQQGQPALFDFVRGCLEYLDEETSPVASLHLYFLVELSRFLGFAPNNNFSVSEPFFDCREGAFTPVALAFPLGLNAPDSASFSAFLGSDILHAPSSVVQRHRMLEVLTAYFQLHVPGFSGLSSTEVLRQVLAG